ncbi:hypothetical protein OROGR_025270 [Orobanche gracilis]
MPPRVAPVPVQDPPNNTDSILYVHPSEGPNSVTVTPLFNGSNYLAWSRSMRRSLGATNKLAFIDRSIPIPDMLDLNSSAWECCNHLVHSWIINFVSESIAQTLVFHESALDAWEDLSERFAKADRIRIVSLRSALHNLKQAMAYGIGSDGMKTTVEVILLVHEHINSHILLLKHADSYYMFQGGCLKPGDIEIEGLKRKLTSKLGYVLVVKIQLTVEAKLSLAKINTADLVHEEIHPHLLLLKIAGSYFMLPENLKRKLTCMLGPTKPEFMPNWQGNQNSPVTILLAIKDVFSMIQHTLVDKKLAFLYSKESPTKFTLMPIIILKHKHSSQKLGRKQSQKFKRESKAKKLSQIPSRKAILIGMTYENLKNDELLLECDAIEVDELQEILLKHHDFPMENVVVMTEKVKNKLHMPTKENIRWEIRKLLKEAKGSDILFLYVSGHGERDNNQSVGVTSCDDKPLMENYWSGIMRKVPRGVTLTTMMNTCYGGKLFEEAAESEGDVISFSYCGANEIGRSGEFWFRVLSPIMQCGKGKTNERIFNEVKKYMLRVNPNLTPTLHCKESSLGKQFLC